MEYKHTADSQNCKLTTFVVWLCTLLHHVTSQMYVILKIPTPLLGLQENSKAKAVVALSQNLHEAAIRPKYYDDR